MTGIECAEWIAHVRKYVLQFGEYNFGQAECKWMQPYIHDARLHELVDRTARFGWSCRLQLSTTWDLMDELERGIAVAVTAKLTQ